MTSVDEQIITVFGTIMGTLITVIGALWAAGKWLKRKGAAEQNDADRITFLEKQIQTLFEQFQNLKSDTNEGIQDLAKRMAKVSEEMAYISGQLKVMTENGHNHS